MTSTPIGIKVFSNLYNFENKRYSKRFHQILVLFLTFLSYAALHACRKVLPVVKPKLQGDCNTEVGFCVNGFEPFDTGMRKFYFGALDLSWSAAYAFGMLGMGFAAEKYGRKLLLTISLLGTSFCVISFGLGFYLEIHSFYYYLYLQMVNGLVQSGGWPTLVPIVSSWIPKKVMGTIMGIWGNHYAVGNIIGQTLSAQFVDIDWGMSFLSNGLICGVIGILVLLFLASKPASVGLNEKETEFILKDTKDGHDNSIESGEIVDTMIHRRIGFFQAMFLPGVLEFSFSLFFCKIVIYTFLFWLPFYINQIGIKDYELSASSSGFLAALFDFGGIAGNIVTGFIIDYFHCSGLIVFILQMLSAASIYLFSAYGHASYYHCVGLLLIAGFFVNSPNSLITGTISASLSNHPKLEGNKHGASIITAIVDGIGCMGAVVAPILVTQLSSFGWNYVMYSLIISCVMSGALLIRLVTQELTK